jgi:hypothetical protein
MVLRFDWFAPAAMTALACHVCAAAHPVPRRRRHFTTDWLSHGKNRQSDDRDKAARQRRDHDVEVNTVIMRINVGPSCAFGEMNSCENQWMKLFLALLALAVPGAFGQSVEIVSPSKAYTFAYGDAISHQIERDHFSNEMIARVTFSNYAYAGDREPRRDEAFDFVFPGLRFDAARNEFVARTRHQVRIAIAALSPNFPYAGYKLEPNAQIFLVKRSGHVTAVLNATAQPQGGGRWVQVDDNWSLQNLLALGFERLTR